VSVHTTDGEHIVLAASVAQTEILAGTSACRFCSR
jgi:hypothetical protein